MSLKTSTAILAKNQTETADTAPTTFPTVSVIIVTMNSAAFISKALDSIRTQRYPADRMQTIVVDHGSHDGTVERIRRDYPWVTVLAETVNHGFAGGNNVAMRAYPADYYALVNPDATLAPGWLSILVDRLESDPTIGVVGCKIFYSDGKLLQHAGAMFRDNALTYHFGDHEPDHGQYDEQRDVDYVMGAAFVARGELTRRLGYLPEEYFPAYYEESDFCTQVRKAGKRVVYVPTAVAWHDEKHSGSGRFTRKFLRRYHKHRYLYVLRNFTTDEERQKFTVAERAWRRQYANNIPGRALLIYSKLVNWRWLIRRPWLFRV
jgi:GT2 family glycosyltransferase